MKEYDIYGYQERMTICAAVTEAVDTEDKSRPLPDSMIAEIVSEATGIELDKQKAQYYRHKLGYRGSRKRKADYKESGGTKT